jgi:hypothetical protein
VSWPAIVAGALVLRVIGLNSGLWFDEIVTLVESARLPLTRILTDFPGVNAHPFYSVLAHVSIAALGDSAWALRLPACLFGVAVRVDGLRARRAHDWPRRGAGWRRRHGDVLSPHLVFTERARLHECWASSPSSRLSICFARSSSAARAIT